MKKYEIMYIVNASLDEEQFKAVQDRLHATITSNEGTIDKQMTGESKISRTKLTT